MALASRDIKYEVLTELREHVQDKIPDISVYSTVVYGQSLAKLSKTSGSIMTSHIELLPIIYVYDDLQLGEESFANRVNQSILCFVERSQN